MGTENCYSVLKAMQEYLTPRMELKLKSMAAEYRRKRRRQRRENGGREEFDCKYLVWRPVVKAPTGFHTRPRS